jgi:hypothetical protein
MPMSILDPLHGTAEMAREPGDERFLRVEARLRAEASSDVGRGDDADLMLWHSE